MTPDEALELIDYEILLAEDKANNKVYTDDYRCVWKEVADRLKTLRNKLLTPISK